MSLDGWKQRFVVAHNLQHIDPVIASVLMDLDVLASIVDHQSLANELISKILNTYNFRFLDVDSSNWSERLKSFVPDDDEDDDESVGYSREDFFSGDSEEEGDSGEEYLSSSHGAELSAFIPSEVRSEFARDFYQAYQELKSLQTEIDQARPATSIRTRKLIVFSPKTPRQIDWSVWLSKPSLSVDEAAAMLLGLEPEDVKCPLEEIPAQFRVPYLRKLDDLKRHIDVGHISKPITVEKLIRWAHKYGVEIPDELSGYNRQSLSIKGNLVGDDLHHHTKSAFQNFLIYIAIKHYGLNINNFEHELRSNVKLLSGVGKTSVASKISNDLSSVDLDITPKTLDKLLHQALDDFKRKGMNLQKLETLAKRSQR